MDLILLRAYQLQQILTALQVFTSLIMNNLTI